MKAQRSLKGFTLIELLIVVAIIAILAAIAVPNFLEAQTRAKVSRVKSDMRSLATAIEAYAVDHNKYPICRGRGSAFESGGTHHIIDLTTPISYITSVSIADPFKPPAPRDANGWLIGSPTPGSDPYSYGYACIQYAQETLGYPPHHSKYVMVSNGPDKKKGPDAMNPQNEFWFLWYADTRLDPDGTGWFVRWQYDPTNGTASNGDIMRFQAGQK